MINRGRLELATSAIADRAIHLSSSNGWPEPTKFLVDMLKLAHWLRMTDQDYACSDTFYACSDTKPSDPVIRKRSDYVTEVKDRGWASNCIKEESDWTVQDCTQYRMAGNFKIRPVLYICFPTFVQLPDKCSNICVVFLENLFIEITTYMVKRVTITQEKC